MFLGFKLGITLDTGKSLVSPSPKSKASSKQKGTEQNPLKRVHRQGKVAGENMNDADDDDVDDVSHESFVDRIKQFIRRRRVSLFTVATFIAAFLTYRKRRLLLRILQHGYQRPTYFTATEAPISVLLQAARAETLQQAFWGSGVVYFRNRGEWKRATVPPEFQSDLFDTLQKTCKDLSVIPSSIWSRLATPVIASLPFVYLALVYRMLNNMQGNSGLVTISANASNPRKVTFRDVAGLDDVIVEVSEVVRYLKDPGRFRQLGARPPSAVLLYGPPGTGKTLLAQAVAGEAAVDCFLACSASSFVELYVGRGAARIRSLFAQARRQASATARKRQGWSWWKPVNQHRRPSAIIFLDELDALAKTRSSISSSDEREQALNQLLTEMDGFDRDAENVTVIVMAASNRVDVLDPAVIRRFERQVHVGYPNASGRASILLTHSRHIQHSMINWDDLASQSDGFSGADLRNALNEAAILAVREGCGAVEQHHIVHAIRKIRDMKSHHEHPKRIIPLAFEGWQTS